MSRGYGELVEDFIQKSKHETYSDKYDIMKLLSNILTYGEELGKHFGTNKYILDRKYQELGMIVSGESNLFEEVKELHIKIEYDIVRIYRTRNVLVHSGNTAQTNILLKC